MNQLRSIFLNKNIGSFSTRQRYVIRTDHCSLNENTANNRRSDRCKEAESDVQGDEEVLCILISKLLKRVNNI